MWYSWNEILENDETLSSYIRLSGVQVVWLISRVDFWLCSGIEVQQDTFPVCIQAGCAIGEKLSLWNQGHEFTTLWTHLLCCIQGLWVTPLIIGNFLTHICYLSLESTMWCYVDRWKEVHTHDWESHSECMFTSEWVTQESLCSMFPAHIALHTFFHPSQQSHDGALQV